MRPVAFHLADRQMEEGVRAFFRRPGWHHKLGCGEFAIDPDNDQDIFRNPLHTDPGVFREAHNNLRVYQNTHEHAIVILDEQFSGTPGAIEIQRKVTRNLVRSGWRTNCVAVIVIQPMMEAWLWTDNVNAERVFGHRPPPSLRQKMQNEQLWPAGQDKPTDLKVATAIAARWGDKVSDSALFSAVFGSARSLAGCREPGFLMLRQTLQTWFP